MGASNGRHLWLFYADKFNYLSIDFHIEPSDWPWGGDSYVEPMGMFVEILNLAPKGDQSGRGLSKFWPPKEKKEEKRKFYFCFYSRNSVFLRRTLNETLAA